MQVDHGIYLASCDDEDVDQMLLKRTTSLTKINPGERAPSVDSKSNLECLKSMMVKKEEGSLNLQNQCQTSGNNVPGLRGMGFVEPDEELECQAEKRLLDLRSENK